MQTTHRNRRYRATPAVGVLIGVAYLIAFWIGGQPRNGVIGLVLIGFVELARGREGEQFALAGAVGGLACVGAPAYRRLRG